MRLYKLIFTTSILITTLVTAQQQEQQDTTLQQQHNQQEDANIDDTSLFRGVENAIDEDSEQDAYRILKSLQDSTEEDYTEDELEEEEIIDHSSSKEIKQRIQPEENDPLEEEEEEEELEDDDTMMEVEDDEDEEEEEEEDDDFSADSFLPDFKNEATQDFFQHLPSSSSQQSTDTDTKEEELVEPIEEEEADEDVILDHHNDIHDEEGYDDLTEVTEPVLPSSSPSTSTSTQQQQPFDPLLRNNHNEIPWHRPDKIVESNNKFYQDTNAIRKQQEELKKKSTTGFRFWHALFISLILVIIYNKLTNKRKVFLTLLLKLG